jgi:hypothetical protein
MILNTEMVESIEVMLEQTLYHTMQNSVVFCKAMLLWTI